MKLRTHSYFTIVLALVIAWALWEARNWPLRANILILVLGGIGLLLVLAQLYKELRSSGKIQSSGMDIEADEELTGKKATPRILAFSAWLLGLFVGIWLIGFAVAVPLFSLLYAKTNGARWLTSLIIAAVNFLFLRLLYEELLHIPWPDPFLQQWIPFLPG